MLEFPDGRVAKWWMREDVVFVDAMPLGATGKVQKSVLRERYAAALSRSGPGPAGR